MKHTLLLVLLSFFTIFPVDAQRIRFTDTTNKWAMVALTGDPSSSPGGAGYDRDTIISGMLYHKLFAGGAGSYETLAVREDTLIGKLYFRFLSRTYSGVNADSLEHVLFDYKLRVGDTLKMAFSSVTAYFIVERLDSVLLGTDYYKHWALKMFSNARYEFIEGIGTNHGPAHMFYPLGLVPVQYQLRCFTNNGITPPCSPAIYVPFGGYQPTWSWEPKTVDSFDNLKSCSFKLSTSSSIAGTERIVAPICSPNPGSKEICLIVPDAFINARLQITDVIGHCILQKVIDERKTNIGQYLTAPGIYYYAVQDGAGKCYNGRFIFR